MKCLLLDANVVIDLHKLGYWDDFVTRNEVYLPETVLVKEAQFYRDEIGDKHYLDIDADQAAGRITRLSASAAEQMAIASRLRKAAIKLDEGELEGPAIAAAPPVGGLRFCLFERAATKAAGVLQMRGNVVSVQEALESCGLKSTLPEHSRARFESLLREGWRLGFQSG